MGLPTALLLARSGIGVYGYDIDKEKIGRLQHGLLPFEEKDLSELFKQAHHHFVPIDTLEPSEVFILTLPTPITKNKTCDISYVVSAVKSVCSVLKDGDLVILESTVSPGTTVNIIKPLLDETGKKYFLSYVSEKAIPGDTIHEMQYNHRIIGGINEESARLTKQVYERFVTGSIHLTDCTTAETVKLLENTYRDVNIALANELSQRLVQFDVNAWEAIKLANFHPRVNLHKPGPGVGGHCIAIDPWFLVNEDTPLIHLARKINDSMPKKVCSLVEQVVGNKTDASIVLLGVSYKGNVDDDRESPSYDIRSLLESKGYLVSLYDPLIKDNPDISTDLSNVIHDADCLVLVTDHNEFKTIDPAGITNMRSKNLVDTRNLVDHKKWKDNGFSVTVLGRS
jgi:UDP-N-acetyl-D-mannosaminuronic acid dehydrogenase